MTQTTGAWQFNIERLITSVFDFQPRCISAITLDRFRSGVFCASDSEPSCGTYGAKRFAVADYSQLGNSSNRNQFKELSNREYLKRPLAIPPQVVENAAYADVAKLVDARDLKSLGAICTGSTPVVRTNYNGLCPLSPVLFLSLFSAAGCVRVPSRS